MNYDAKGRLAQISDQTRTYLNGLQYQGKGNSVNALTFGNGTTQNFVMNDRLQMSSQELKRGAEVLQKYDYGYGQIDAAGNLDVTKNNGQLARVESHIGTAKQWTQKFNYDALGRLSESKEYRGDTNALSYKQKFDYDKFGNLYRKNSSNPVTGQENPLAFTPIEDADISKATNRFATNTTYDDAGNVIVDSKFRTSNFAYDANGRMVKATRANVPDATSIYDASGMRVAEKVNDIWRFLIYDIGGKLIAEYGGLQSSDEGGVKYLFSDWQGSTRAIVSQGGYIQARMDYTAFGEDIQAGTGIRTTAQGFNSSNNLRQKYGLTERDEATGLDHTWFRKNENRAGRWTSPDPYNGSMNLGNPQSFNRYSYVENQPTNYVDPTGLQQASPGSRCSYSVDDGTGNIITFNGRIDRFGNCSVTEQGTTQIEWNSPWMGGSSTGIITQPQDQTIDVGGGAGANINSQATDPCANKGQLQYSQRTLTHITERHIEQTPRNIGASYYIFGLTTPTLGAKQSKVKSINQLTFQNGGASISVSGGNTAYVYVYAPKFDFNLIQGVAIGRDSSHSFDVTNVNTVVIKDDCQTVITSHPGLPTRPPNPNVVGTPTWWKAITLPF